MDQKELQVRKEIQELSFLIFTEPNNYKHYYERGILYGGEHIKSTECRESDYHG
ncbi:hypothetical protein CA163_22430, partial [Vibrio parahaemolyticus]